MGALTFYTPAPPKVEWGYTGFTLSVRPSVRPSIRPSGDKVSGTFWKNWWFNSFHTWHLPLWGESLVQPHFQPSGGQIFGRKWGFRNFLKKLLAQFISYLAFTLMGWVSWPLYIFVFLASFPALWWPNIWPKMGSPELFEKTIGSIHFIPGIYPYGVSLLTPIHFRVSGLIFSPLVAKYLAENGSPELFEKTIGSVHFIPGIYPYGVSLLTPIHFRVPSLIFSPLVAKYLAENGVSRTFWNFFGSIQCFPEEFPPL